MNATQNMKRMNLPIVCDLSVFTPEERKEHLDSSAKIFTNAKRVLEIDDGYAFHFDHSEDLVIQLATWINNDNRCCPFLTHELAIEPFESGHEAIVRMRGSEEIKQALRTDFVKWGIELKD